MVQSVAQRLQDAGIAVQFNRTVFEHSTMNTILAVFALVNDPSGVTLTRARHIHAHSLSAQDANHLIAASQQSHTAWDRLDFDALHDAGDITAGGLRAIRHLSRVVGSLRHARTITGGLAAYLFEWTDFGISTVTQVRGGPPADGEFTRVLATVVRAALAYDQLVDNNVSSADPGVPTRPRADWKGFLDFLHVVTRLRAEDSVAPRESARRASNAVQIMTVHASKGLEFPVVFIPELAQLRFPLQSRTSVIPLVLVDGKRVQFDGNDAAAHLLDEARLFYVAITRARDRLHMSYSQEYAGVPARPSEFLDPFTLGTSQYVVVEQMQPDTPATDNNLATVGALPGGNHGRGEA